MAGKLAFAALVFDLGGVIIPHDNEQLYRRLAASCTAPDAIEVIRAKAADPRYYTGELTIAALHRDLRRELGYGLDWHGFQLDWRCHLSLDRGMLELVERLARTTRVMIFSNTNREHWEYLVEFTGGALGRLEAYLSYEIGLAKPDLASFRAVAARAGIDPGRSLFIDDREENVTAARHAGFHAEIFTDQASLEQVLAAAELWPSASGFG